MLFSFNFCRRRNRGSCALLNHDRLTPLRSLISNACHIIVSEVLVFRYTNRSIAVFMLCIVTSIQIYSAGNEHFSCCSNMRRLCMKTVSQLLFYGQKLRYNLLSLSNISAVGDQATGFADSSYDFLKQKFNLKSFYFLIAIYL